MPLWKLAGTIIDAQTGVGQTAGMKDNSDRPSQKLVVRDGVPMLGSRCSDTRSGVRADFEALRWEIRQGIQYIQAKKADGITLSVNDIKRELQGTLLVGGGVSRGYASDRDINSLIDHPAQGASKLAQELIAKATGLAPQTIQTYVKARRKRSNRPSKPRRATL